MDDGVVVMVDGRVRVLHKGGHRDEESLRQLLDTRPDLVLSNAPADDRRRLLLVSRRVSADDLSEPDALPLERVYVDSEGVPLLVGVRVAPHPPPDGAVLLRLLDRVAEELPRWRNGRLRELTRVTHAYREDAELLAGTLDWRAGAGAFWARVESHLARGHVRIVMVADELPEGLARTVEFLDDQLRDIEVRAVAVSSYGSGEICAFVPRSTRGGSAARPARHAASRSEPPPLPQRTPPGAATGATVLGFKDPERRVGVGAGGRHRLPVGDRRL